VQRKAREAISIAAGRLLPLTTRLCGSLKKQPELRKYFIRVEKI